MAISFPFSDPDVSGTNVGIVEIIALDKVETLHLELWHLRYAKVLHYNKIIPAIQSRCTRFRFSPLPNAEVEKRVDSVIEAEGYEL